MILNCQTIPLAAKEEVFGHLEKILMEWIPNDLIEIPENCTKRLSEVLISKWIQFIESEMVHELQNTHIIKSIAYFNERKVILSKYHERIKVELLKSELASLNDTSVWKQLQHLLKTMIEFNHDCEVFIKCLTLFLKYSNKFSNYENYPDILGLLYTQSKENSLNTKAIEVLFHSIVWSIRIESLEKLKLNSLPKVSEFTSDSALFVLNNLLCLEEVFNTFNKELLFQNHVTLTNTQNLSKELLLSIAYLNDLVYVMRAKDSVSFKLIVGKIDNFQGKQWEDNLINLQNQLFDHLNSLDTYSSLLFNTHYDKWKEQLVVFKVKWNMCEQNLIGIINQTFDSTESIERKISLVRLYKHYSLSDKCTLFIETQCKHISQLIHNRLHLIKKKFDDQKLEPEIPIGHYKFSGSASWALHYLDHIKYLEVQLKLVIEEPEMKEIELIKQHIKDYISHTFHLWKSSLADDMDLYLKYPIMEMKSNSMLACNLDPKFKLAINEGMSWKKLGFEVPDRFQYYFESFSEILQAEEKVIELINKFNYISEHSNTNYDCLFHPLIKEAITICQKGFYDVNWTNLLEVFNFCKHSTFSIMNTVKLCSKTKELLDSYLNQIISYKSMNIMDKIVIPDDSIPFDDLCLLLQDEINVIIDQFTHIVKEMESLKLNLQSTLRYFNDDLWKLIRPELVLMINSTLMGIESSIIKQLSNWFTTKKNEEDFDLNIELKVKLDNSKLFIDPRQEVLMEQLTLFKSELHTLFSHCVEGSKSVQFDIPLELSHTIPEMYLECEKQLDLYTEFKDVYELNKESYIRRFNKQNPKAASYDMDIQKYEDYIYQINGKLEDEQSVNIFVLNHLEAKQSLYQHCNSWRDKLKDLLYQNTLKFVDQFKETKDVGLKKELDELILVLEKNKVDTKQIYMKYKAVSK